MPPPNNTSTTTPPETIKQITTLLLDRYTLPISPTYLTTFLATSRSPLPPIPALVSTLHFRLLASDITSSLSPTNPLPQNITSPNIKSQTLPKHTPVQLLDIIDIGTSKYTQLQTLEMIERGETIKGREIIRTVNLEAAEHEHGATSTSAAPARTARTNASANAPGVASSNGPFKLLLQDAKGAKVYAFTVSAIPKIGMPMPGDEGSGAMCIGCKLVLKKGTVVRRGVVMVNPGDVTVLGGKVDGWDKQWRDLAGRKKRLEEGMVTI
jgi:RecQ-mediated genome instability protein 1